jgi:hypothetical protein
LEAISERNKQGKHIPLELCGEENFGDVTPSSVYAKHVSSPVE